MKNRKFTKNFPLKILSVVVGILVWLLVVNVNNPTISKPYTKLVSQIEILNEAYIDSYGKMYMLDDSQTSVRVTIEGNKKTIDQIRNEDIIVAADLQQAISLDTTPVMVPLTVTCNGVSSSSIKVDITPKNLSIVTEDKKTQEFVVNVTRGDTKPGKGYEVGTLSSSPEKVKITGPTSLINIIDTVSAYVSVEGKTEDVIKEVELSIVDKNGNRLSDKQLNYLNVPKVTVTAKLWKTVNMYVDAGYTGEPAEGYYVEDMTILPESISVTGSEESLGNIEYVNGRRTLYAGDIDVSGKTEDFEEKINITEMLPDGISLTSDVSTDVWVRINILPEGSTVYNIPTKNVILQNQPEDKQVIFETDKIEIRIKKEEDKELLKEEDITLSIDLTDMEEGIFEIPVSVELPEGYELVQDVTTEVEVGKIEVTEAGREQGE